MNANELAGLIELAPDYIQYRQEAATMLRQQQAEIEALRVQLEGSIDEYCQLLNG